MIQPKIVNKFGKLIGWNDVKFSPLGRTLELITEFEYDDNVDMEYVHGAGRMPVGLSEKNYTATASFTLYAEELIILENSLPKGTRIQDIPAFDVPSEYDLDGVIRKDIVRGVKIKNNGRSFKNNEGVSLKKIELAVSHIDWGV